MGGILISQNTIKRWREDNDLANMMLNIEPINSQERDIIHSAQRERTGKLVIIFLMSLSFWLSLKRYFPGAALINNNFNYVCILGSILLPAMSLGFVHTNREVILRLRPIKINHDIIRAKID